MTEHGPCASRSMMPRRIGSDRAAKISSSGLPSVPMPLVRVGCERIRTATVTVPARDGTVLDSLGCRRRRLLNDIPFQALRRRHDVRPFGFGHPERLEGGGDMSKEDLPFLQA